MENDTDVRAALHKAKGLVEAGAWDDAIQLLTEANRQHAHGRIETQLVKLRHLAYNAQETLSPATAWPRQVPDHFPGTTTVPEISATDLSAELVASAIQHHGSIIVRGLFDAQACAEVRDVIDNAFAGAEAVAGQKDFEPTPWFTHFIAQRNMGYSFGGVERQFVTYGAGVLAVDSPRGLFRYIECLKDAGFDKFLQDYFGERPTLSAKKSTLRRTPHNADAGWHQDGGYFRTDVRALNLWAAFSPCGVNAPSIDIFAKRIDHIVEQGGAGSSREARDAVGEDIAAQYGLEHVVRPVFEPGDALLFDDMALHRTGVDKSMTETRYAVEMWFFAASMFPRDQVPLYL